MAASEDGRWRPPADKVTEVRELALRIVEMVRPAAREMGYAIGVHGSLERDLDLIAAPWIDEAAPAEKLVEAVRLAIAKGTGDDCYKSHDVDLKPQGRRAWTLYFQAAVSTTNGAYPFIDLSVLPRLNG